MPSQHSCSHPETSAVPISVFQECGCSLPMGCTHPFPLGRAYTTQYHQQSCVGIELGRKHAHNRPQWGRVPSCAAWLHHPKCSGTTPLGCHRTLDPSTVPCANGEDDSGA